MRNCSKIIKRSNFWKQFSYFICHVVFVFWSSRTYWIGFNYHHLSDIFEGEFYISRMPAQNTAIETKVIAWSSNTYTRRAESKFVSYSFVWSLCRHQIKQLVFSQIEFYYCFLFRPFPLCHDPNSDAFWFQWNSKERC